MPSSSVSCRGPDGGHLYRIAFHHAGEDPRVALREEASLAPAEVDELVARLARLDRASSHGPWTRATLELIASHPERRAGDLAAMVGREIQPFKTDVRKLKALGLTESLEVGYRLSPPRSGPAGPAPHLTPTPSARASLS